MTTVSPWVWLFAGAIVGAVMGWLAAVARAGKREQAMQIELEVLRSRQQSEVELERERNLVLERAQERLKSAFDELANSSLKNNSELFLQLARQNLSQQQLQANHTLKEREQAIETLLKPIQEALNKTHAQIQHIEKERHESFGALRSYLESINQNQSALQTETRRLVNALRRPEVRGQWGEISLRRLVELAGMTPHCDFTEQMHTVTTDGAIRPDMVVHMPDGRDLVVDVKTPLDAYLEAVDAPNDELRAIALKRHAYIVGERVRLLASKAYWSQFANSPDFVILFIPGDQFLSAALQEQPNLLDEAIRQSVILTTPTSFIAMLKAIAYGWRQLALAQNAATIRDLGEDIYKRLSTFGSHLGKLGKSLGSSVDAYNSAIGSLERQVMPAARRFNELGLKSERSIDVLEPIDKLARTPLQDAPQDTNNNADALPGDEAKSPEQS